MGLKDLRIPEEVVETRAGKFSVRGLSADDVSFLVKYHGDDLTSLFNDFIAEENELTSDQVMKFVLPIIQQLPVLVAKLIACAADDPEQFDLVRRLPISAQADALEKIVVLSFDAEGGPKKFAETVVRLLEGTNGLLTSLKA